MMRFGFLFSVLCTLMICVCVTFPTGITAVNTSIRSHKVIEYLQKKISSADQLQQSVSRVSTTNTSGHELAAALGLVSAKANTELENLRKATAQINERMALSSNMVHISSNLIQDLISETALTEKSGAISEEFGSLGNAHLFSHLHEFSDALSVPVGLHDVFLSLGYKKCAKEGSYCKCHDGLIVYGNGNKFTTPQAVTSSVKCNATLFSVAQRNAEESNLVKVGNSGDYEILLRKKTPEETSGQESLASSLISMQDNMTGSVDNQEQYCLCKNNL